jgi:tryptophan synthase alpha chain
MSAISNAFRHAATSGSHGVIPYITAGFPDLATTEEIIVALGQAGATAIEVGVPFSDPMADGPVIQRACEHALAQHVTLGAILKTIAAAKQKTDVPVVLFSYLNPLLQFGLQRLALEGAASGVSGVLVTDLPADAGSRFAAELRREDLDFITLVTPTSTDRRLRQILAAASGFLYAVSRTGVTGTQEQISGDARDLVKRVRALSDLPIALGFGISNVDHAREAWGYCDAIVIGSALVKLIGNSPKGSEAAEAKKFIQQFTSVQAAAAATEKQSC